MKVILILAVLLVPTQVKAFDCFFGLFDWMFVEKVYVKKEQPKPKKVVRHEKPAVDKPSNPWQVFKKPVAKKPANEPAWHEKSWLEKMFDPLKRGIETDEPRIITDERTDTEPVK